MITSEYTDRALRLIGSRISKSFKISYYILPRIIFHGIILASIVCGFWLLDSLKDPILINTVGIEYQPIAKLLSVLSTLVVVCLYDFLTSIVTKQTLFHIISWSFCIIIMIISAYLSDPSIGLSNNSNDIGPHRYIGWITFFVIEAYGSLMVALFWSFTNSIMDLEQAKGAYGLIIAIAQFGAIIGSTVATNAQYIGIPQLFIIASIMIFIVSLLVKAYYICFQDKFTILLSNSRVISSNEASFDEDDHDDDVVVTRVDYKNNHDKHSYRGISNSYQQYNNNSSNVEKGDTKDRINKNYSNDDNGDFESNEDNNNFFLLTPPKDNNVVSWRRDTLLDDKEKDYDKSSSSSSYFRSEVLAINVTNIDNTDTRQKNRDKNTVSPLSSPPLHSASSLSTSQLLLSSPSSPPLSSPSSVASYHIKSLLSKTIHRLSASFLEGLLLILKHPYVLKIMCVSCLFEIVVTILDYQFKLLSSHSITAKQLQIALLTSSSSSSTTTQSSLSSSSSSLSSSKINQYTSNIDSYTINTSDSLVKLLGHFGQSTNILSFLLSFFGFSYLVHNFGVSKSLLIFPIILMISVILANLIPSLPILFIIVSVMKAMIFSLQDPIHELLYIPTSDAIKFKAKAWIDVFGSRVAKAIGSTICNFSKANIQNLHNIAEIPCILIATFIIYITYQVGIEFEMLIISNHVVGGDSNNSNDDIKHSKTSKQHQQLDISLMNDGVAIDVEEEEEEDGNGDSWHSGSPSKSNSDFQ